MDNSPQVVQYNNNEMTIKNINVDRFKDVILGLSWFGCENNKEQYISKKNPLPQTTDDEQILPFWSGKWKYKTAEFQEPSNYFSITIQHLCGYNYTKESYEIEARKLESWGFNCLRSRRGVNGHYWELWYIPGLFAAEGDLKNYLESISPTEFLFNDKELAPKVVKWLCENCSFGTLNITSQAAAMTIDGE